MCINCICDKKRGRKSFSRQKKYIKLLFDVQFKIIYFMFVTSSPFYGDITILHAAPKRFRAIPKISRLFRNFPGYLEIFQAIWKVSGLSGNYPGWPETFRTIRKLSWPETFQAIWKLFRLSRNFDWLTVSCQAIINVHIVENSCGENGWSLVWADIWLYPGVHQLLQK